MARINAVQKEYLRGRIWKIKQKKRDALDQKCHRETDALRNLMEKERAKQIKNGTAKIKKKMPTKIIYVIDVFDFTGTEKKIDEKISAIVKKRDAAVEALKKKERTIMDEIILGDPTQAVKKLEEFEKMS